MDYDAGKRSKGRKRFFLMNMAGNLLASWVVAAAWNTLALGNELVDRLQTVFVDGGFGRVFASA
ncbi:hypothetical protein [Hymenobacter terrenus]|uniref:hypothetical protein n=1 Tax=Hymenobacter terrenus TaxID=1629124 RepID=UPI00061A08EB|nr:hypothetical protein [Hymenobacter terrenus]